AKPSHGPAPSAAPWRRAPAELVCGAAVRVPDATAKYPPSQVDTIRPPGAAIVCIASVGATAKLEKAARASSVSLGAQLGGFPRPPGVPSLSAIAVTLSTSGYAAGSTAAKSDASLPAAATKVTPRSTVAQIALCKASRVVLPQSRSLAPTPLKLRFATRMLRLLACAATQSMPQIACAVVPRPD